MREKLAAILTLNKNDFQGSDDPLLQKLVAMLERLPPTVVESALHEYFLFPPSNFFSQGHLMTLVQKHLALYMRLPTVEKSWEAIQFYKRRYGAGQRIPIDPTIDELIEYFGGWAYVVDNINEYTWTKAYAQKIDTITKNKIMSLTK